MVPGSISEYTTLHPQNPDLSIAQIDVNHSCDAAATGFSLLLDCALKKACALGHSEA